MALRILIVDDDKHICRILQTLLQRDPPLRERGVQVRVAGEGAQGLAVLDEGPVDLVISDLCMPGMDGFAFCRELRRRPEGARVPLIVSSAIYKDPITVRKLRVEVDAEFFTKPFQLAEMLAAVRRLLGIRLPEEAPAEAPQAPAVGDAGDLGERPLPGLLLDLFEARSSACLHLARGGLWRRVHLLHGHVISLESSCRPGALGAFLRDKGLLTEAQLLAALAVVRDEGRHLGQVLVEQGLLSEAQLLQELEAQMRCRLGEVLRWPRGRWQLEAPGAQADRLCLQGGTALLVFTALRDTACPEELAELRAEALSMSTRLRLTPRALRLREPFEKVFGAESLTALQRRPLLGELLAEAGEAGLGAVLNRIHAMELTGMCEREEVRPREGRGRTDRPGLRPMKSLPIGPGTVEIQLHGTPTPEPRPALDPRHQQLLGEYLATGGLSHYALLGVPEDAPAAVIDKAYEAAMERLRPERFSDLDLGRDHGKISELRERFRLAHQVLSSPLRRAAYDEDLRRAPEEMSPRKIDAELRFRRGEALLGEGQLGPALTLLEEAADLAPEQADYLALAGWARFLSLRQDGASAEEAAEGALLPLQRALDIDELHGQAHACLGHIYLAIGDDGRAVPHYERALRIAPERRDVRAGLARALELGSRRGQQEHA